MWMGAAWRERPAEEEKAAVLCSGADALRVTAVWSCIEDGGGGCCECKRVGKQFKYRVAQKNFN